jgi:hypothetical protein
MIWPGIWQATNHHVRIADSLHLVHVVVAHDCGIEASVQVVEQIDNLNGRAVVGDCRETDDVCWRE